MNLNLNQIFAEICEFNSVFERTRGMGVDWEKEYKYFREEVEELQEARDNKDFVEVIDALADIVVFATGALHKKGLKSTEITTDVELETQKFKPYDDILLDLENEMSEILNGDVYSAKAIRVIAICLYILEHNITEDQIQDVFTEVYESNMSKLGTDGKPVPGNIPGKFGKWPNYFRPDLKKILS